MKKGTRRLLLSLPLAAVVLLACEGALALCGQPSLVRGVLGLMRSGPAALPSVTLDDAFRERAAADVAGLNRLHPDPRVGVTLRTNADLTIHDGRIRSDDLGLRRRPGPAQPADAFRVIVVGASIPFGYGVDDDETLAHRLELALGGARASGGRPVVCRTVAIGRWSHRNAVHFVLDHWTELQPDLVLYMPFRNDMSDTPVVHEGGFRHAWPDASSPDPWLLVDTDQIRRRMLRLEQLVDAGRLAAHELGAHALLSDLSPESSRRYDANAASIARLADQAEARGARVAFVQFDEHAHTWLLQDRLASIGCRLPVLPLFTSFPEELSLGFDPHPSAAAYEVMARWLASELLARGWLVGGSAAGSLVEPRWEALRAQRRSADEVHDLAVAARQVAADRLLPEVDFRTGRGAAQIYAGVGAEGLAGPRVAVVLAAAGPEIEVELLPLPGRADLLPLSVGVDVDGVRLGELHLTAAGPARGVFRRPVPVDPGAVAVEVRLVPETWVVQRLERHSLLASCVPVRISCR